MLTGDLGGRPGVAGRPAVPDFQRCERQQNVPLGCAKWRQRVSCRIPLCQRQRLLTCEHGRRGISRTDAAGNHTLLVDKVDGLRFNSPNDIAVRQDGSIWFTDPPYGIVGDEEGYRAASQVIGCYVYRFDEARHQVAIAISDTQRPNGLAFSPDDKWLYVADMSVIDFPSQGRREIRAYRLEGQTGYSGRILRRPEREYLLQLRNGDFDFLRRRRITGHHCGPRARL